MFHCPLLNRDTETGEMSPCTATFQRPRDLQRHCETVHRPRSYICVCGSGFTRSDALTRHRKGCNGTSRRPRRRQYDAMHPDGPVAVEEGTDADALGEEEDAEGTGSISGA